MFLPKNHVRLTRLELFMGIADLIAQRGTCLRASVGCVIVQDNRIISTGYVGSPSGRPHCFDVGCEMGPNSGCIRTVHAEANAIAFAAKTGISVNGGSMYCTHSPCLECSRLIVNAGIYSLTYRSLYRDEAGLKLLDQCGVSTTYIGRE